MIAVALMGCGKSLDSIEKQVQGRLADDAPGASAPVKDVACAGYTKHDTPEEGTRLTCEVFSAESDVHDPNDKVGEVIVTVTGGDPQYRFRACRAATTSGPGPKC